MPCWGRPTPSARRGYVRTWSHCCQIDAVITALEAGGYEPTCTVPPRQAVRRIVGDYRRNRPYMHDDKYLARGWPIGTGVVEGACGHLVNERLEQAGMRWTQGGAPGRARPTGRAAEWPRGGVLAVSPPTTPPAIVRHVRPNTSLGRSSSAGVGGLINPLSTNLGHIRRISVSC